MPTPLVLFLHSGGYARAYQAASLAVTAAAMGREVTVALAFDALVAHGEGRFGLPEEAERHLMANAERIGAASPSAMLADARQLGAKLVACETVARISGLEPERLAALVDEVVGLASLVRRFEGAQVLYL